MQPRRIALRRSNEMSALWWPYGRYKILQLKGLPILGAVVSCALRDPHCMGARTGRGWIENSQPQDPNGSVKAETSDISSLTAAICLRNCAELYILTSHIICSVRCRRHSPVSHIEYLNCLGAAVSRGLHTHPHTTQRPFHHECE